MSDISIRPNSVPWPPLLYLAGIAVSILVAILYPLPWFGSPLADLLFAASFLVFAAVVALYVSAFRTLAAGKTTVSPIHGSEHLVTGGAFAISRNPIYLANTLLLIGGGMVSGNPWFLVFAIVCAFATQKLAIEREEKHLEARFGKRYRDYAKRVRRWI
jgi:protein-S-isoprenylcysteine O-methyltransferase Ste14